MRSRLAVGETLLMGASPAGRDPTMNTLKLFPAFYD
jgi:hypothetical protein